MSDITEVTKTPFEKWRAKKNPELRYPTGLTRKGHDGKEEKIVARFKKHYSILDTRIPEQKEINEALRKEYARLGGVYDFNPETQETFVGVGDNQIFEPANEYETRILKQPVHVKVPDGKGGFKTLEVSAEKIQSLVEAEIKPVTLSPISPPVEVSAEKIEEPQEQETVKSKKK